MRRLLAYAHGKPSALPVYEDVGADRSERDPLERWVDPDERDDLFRPILGALVMDHAMAIGRAAMEASPGDGRAGEAWVGVWAEDAVDEVWRIIGVNTRLDGRLLWPWRAGARRAAGAAGLTRPGSGRGWNGRAAAPPQPPPRWCAPDERERPQMPATMTSGGAARRRQMRFARRQSPGSATICRTNGCATRMLATPDGGLRCPICRLVVPGRRAA